jgi:hypothetical protein
MRGVRDASLDGALACPDRRAFGEALPRGDHPTRILSAGFSAKRACERARIMQTPRAAFTRRAEPIHRFSIRLLAEILHCLVRGHIVTILLRRIYDMEVYRECESKCSHHDHSKRER